MKPLLILTLLFSLRSAAQTPAIDSLARERTYWRSYRDSVARSDIPEPDRTILHEYADMQYRVTGELWSDKRKEWMDRRRQILIDSLKRRK